MLKFKSKKQQDNVIGNAWAVWVLSKVKNYLDMQTYTLQQCFDNFHQKNCFYYFGILLRISIKFPQRNINQSKTGIGDKKLSVELYVNKVDKKSEHFVEQVWRTGSFADLTHVKYL